MRCTPQLPARRGPGLGGPCLGKSTDSSQTRASVPIAARPSVHCVPVMGVALGRIKRQGYVKERSQTRIALTQDVFRSAAHGDVERTPKKDGAPVTFRFIDLKAAAALSCSYMIGTGRAGSHTIIVARTCMHHAPTRGCCQASVGNRRRKANRHEPGDRRRQHAVRRWSTSNPNVW